MSKKRKKTQQNNGGEASADSSTPATNGAAAVAEAPAPARGSSSAPRAEGRGPKRLMDTLEADTTPGQLLGLVAAMLAVPTVIALIVKIAILPLFRG